MKFDAAAEGFLAKYLGGLAEAEKERRPSWRSGLPSINPNAKGVSRADERPTPFAMGDMVIRP